jgi:Cu(I)/Ag(I) efflux system membrane fusion protein
MKRYLSISAVFATGLALGVAIATNHVGYKTENKSGATDDKQPLYWVAPMDKNYRRDGPGQSPMGMDLVPVYQEDGAEEGGNTVKISSAVENNLGVKVSAVNTESLAIPISTFGMVQYDESRVTHVHSRVEGWIQRLGIAASGDKVSKGQTLFELYSPSLVSSQEEYLAAKRSGNKTLIKASSARLLSLGLTQTQISELTKRGSVEQTISIIADADGVVIDLNVRKGMYIKPATEVLSFGTLDSVWVMGQILERQSGLVNQGQTVEIKVSALPGKTWEGSVNYVYPELDLTTRTQAIRVRVLNQDRALKPNMLANIQVMHTATSETLTIPRTALIKGANHNRVVRALGDGRYQSTWVDTGLEGLSLPNNSLDSVDVGSIDQRRVQIIRGLSEGDMVVTSAQFLIDSESNIEADLLRRWSPKWKGRQSKTRR